MSIKDIIGDIPLANPPTSELPVEDDLDLARRVWKKGRLEFMGGPVYFTQGNGAAGLVDNNRECNYAYPMGFNTDPIAHDLGVDTTEQ